MKIIMFFFLLFYVSRGSRAWLPRVTIDSQSTRLYFSGKGLYLVPLLLYIILQFCIHPLATLLVGAEPFSLPLDRIIYVVVLSFILLPWSSEQSNCIKKKFLLAIYLTLDYIGHVQGFQIPRRGK